MIKLTAKQSAIGLVIARLFMASHYIFSGGEAFFRYDQGVALVKAYGIPFADIALVPATAVDLVGAALLISGRWQRHGAALLAFWTLFLGVWFHRFWTIDPVTGGLMWQITVDDFFHHFVMFGGLLFVALSPAGEPERKSETA